MKTKISVALIVAASVLAIALAIFFPPFQKTTPQREQNDNPSADNSPTSTPSDSPQRESSQHSRTARAPRASALPAADTAVPHILPESPAPTTNKLERLAQTRESFRALAAGDPASAMRAAKQITDETERETALVTLVTEWTKGELRPPKDRARSIAAYGIEAGLGMELVKNPELASLWANELTDANGRTGLLAATAVAMVGSDPTAAFAMGDQLPQKDRRRFLDSVFAGWANNDTDAALRWLDQIPDPAERDAALTSIRNIAPVGIGAALGHQEDGYTVINDLLPGTPADLSGQLHRGDRIIALAQGDNSFVDIRSLSLPDIVNMIRGTPGSLLQLQVLSADAPANSTPRTVPIIRDQIKYKR